jgi:hypothetical protein
MAPGDLRRDELIELVEAITRGDAAAEEEDDRLVQLSEDSVVHPAAGRWVSACRTSVAADRCSR